MEVELLRCIIKGRGESFHSVITPQGEVVGRELYQYGMEETAPGCSRGRNVFLNAAGSPVGSESSTDKDRLMGGKDTNLFNISFV